MIYKTFTGKYIDIDRLISISDAYFEREQHGYMIVFDMHFQLLEKPIRYHEFFFHYVDEHFGSEEIVKRLKFDATQEDVMNELGEKRILQPFQNKINEIIKVWEGHKKVEK
jgi:hypothetical protein